MKKLLFLIFILISINSNAQCEFNLDELLNLMTSNSSDYETKILTKGYDYDSQREIYFCDIYNKPFRVSKRFQLDKFYGLQYSTFSKENYLEIKKRIIDMKFAFSKEVPIKNTKGLLFIANNIHITLFTETMDLKPLDPVYNVLIQVDLLDVK